MNPFRKHTKISPLYPNHRIVSIEAWKQGEGWKFYNEHCLLVNNLTDALKDNRTKFCLRVFNEISGRTFLSDLSIIDLQRGDYKKLTHRALKRAGMGDSII